MVCILVLGLGFANWSYIAAWPKGTVTGGLLTRALLFLLFTSELSNIQPVEQYVTQNVCGDVFLCCVTNVQPVEPFLLDPRIPNLSL